ncbi:MAG: ribonucleoside-diphosphate reductase subunit alpha, partial [Planctomycetaceae bacterium]|nr:ribonucleoside-diphosphate reductase subunit alpha [Planctomycetaceae bacterium]
MTRPQTDWIVRKRDGRVVPFDLARIGKAMENCFRIELNLAENQPLEEETLSQIKLIASEVSDQIESVASTDQGVEVEHVQDAVEMLMMKHGHYRVARRYIVYRAEHAKLRALRGEEGFADEGPERVQTYVKLDDGSRVSFDPDRISQKLQDACLGLESTCSSEELMEEVLKSIYDGISTKEIYRAMILAARTRIETDPDYDTVAARLMLNVIYHDTLGSVPAPKKMEQVYRNQFEHYIIDGIISERLTPELREFNLTELANALVPQRDELFQYLGVQTIYDRYLIHIDGRRIETPQFFWMRVAMGLSINEGEQRETRAIQFYDMLSSMRFTSATPTLFNSATMHPQLSSCYLSTVEDDLEHIFKVISDNAKLSKWAGGLGNDWTNIRATNSHIHGTNGQSQGVIPFLKVVNDTAVAVNQGGKRKGAVCAYLETWHLDIEEFL